MAIGALRSRKPRVFLKSEVSISVADQVQAMWVSASDTTGYQWKLARKLARKRGQDRLEQAAKIVKGDRSSQSGSMRTVCFSVSRISDCIGPFPDQACWYCETNTALQIYRLRPGNLWIQRYVPWATNLMLISILTSISMVERLLRLSECSVWTEKSLTVQLCSEY